MSKIKITSWNVKGLREIAKIKQVLNRIRQLKSPIVFLHEIHLRATEIDRLQKRWPGQVLCAPYSNHARGVLILIHKSLLFQVANVICDQYGRYIIIQGNISTHRLNLVAYMVQMTITQHFFRISSLVCLPCKACTLLVVILIAL